MEEIKKKTRYEYARELHLTFASVGGGMHLAIFAYKVFDVLAGAQPGSCPDSKLVIALQIALIAVVWPRMYWIYLNTLVFFRPFDNPRIFTLDITAFFLGGIGIFSVGHTTLFFLFCAGSLFACWLRIICTIKEAQALHQLFPKSVEHFTKTQPCFLRYLGIVACFTLSAGISVALAGETWPPLATVACALSLAIYVPVFYHVYDPLYPLSEDFQ